MTTIPFPKNKKFTNFAELLKAIAAERPEINSGVIVLIDDEGAVQVLPICTMSQLAYAAAIMLKEATQ